MPKKASFTFLILILFFSNVNLSFASFGKNKINYKQYKWKVYKSDYFNVYYYPPEENIIKTAIPIIEKTVNEYKKFFSITSKLKIPIIIYHNVYKFRETNIVPYILPEGVGGFTEFSKGRVVVPFNGSLSELEHVLRHELVHEFVLVKISEIRKYNQNIRGIHLPLWFHEGLAEYLSNGFPHQDKIFLSTILKNDRFVSLDRMNSILGTYLMYKEGQAFISFLDEKYGIEIIKKYFETMYLYDNFSDAIENICGDSFDEISYSFEIWLKNQYIFETKKFDNIYDKCKKIKEDIFRYYKTGEDQAVYITNKWGYIDIYKQVNNTEKRLFRIGNKADYEYLSIKNMPVYHHENKLFLGVKYQNNDIIVIYDIKKEKVEKRLKNISNISIIYSINYKNDMLYISGLGNDDKNYIVRYNINTQEYNTVLKTDNSINNFSIYKKKIVFSKEYGKKGYKKIFVYNMNTKKTEKRTNGESNDYFPIYLSNGQIVFLSDREGDTNIYKLSKNKIIKMTEFPVYINNIWKNKNKIYFTAVSRDRTAFRLEEPINKVVQTKDEELSYFTYPKIDKKIIEENTRQYKSKLTLDILKANVMSSPKMGYIGDISLLFSDMLDNEELFFTVGMSDAHHRIENIVKKSNYYLQYVNKYYRWNYYYSLYHFYKPFNYYTSQLYDDLYDERLAGAEAGLIYPFSRFRRISGGVNLNYKEREYIIPHEWYHKYYMSLNFKYVFDNTIWNEVGPIDGWRYLLKYSIDFDLENKLNVFSQYYNVDFRKYFRVFENSAVAARINYAESLGKKREKDILSMGGSLSMRGYRYFHFKGTKLFLFNLEYRFLMIQNIVLDLTSENIILPGVYSSVFFDMGNCWNEDSNNNMHGSYGISFQMGFGAFAIRYDLARKTNFENISYDTAHTFALGWNF
ncbi:MAG: hypothetical protein FXF47_05130 [Candidatus Mcinerneyibacterium aminivorans]|uniref:BamA/TamA family outer membrane protein n=1 Tax=Candidatus Mcinerneyibacterium aminivorans TaxID=2703815 RepID=A0A5D0MBV2_9BACT|nr:MAG: hypothetical protein FXF47_05130 [Candidatus Mcinerneyibacterium aminivorans]